MIELDRPHIPACRLTGLEGREVALDEDPAAVGGGRNGVLSNTL